MTNQQIITLVLSSSLISAFLTKVLDFWVNAINYKRDFYKKIIEKRILAYDELQTAIYPGTLKMLTDDGETTLSIYVDMTKYREFVKLVIKLKYQSAWFSNKTNKSIGLLTGFVANNKKGGVTFDTTDEELEQLGITKYSDVYKLVIAVVDSAAFDFKELHKVKKFLKEKVNKELPIAI